MRLYFVEGWTASNRAVEILEAAGIQFDKISVEGSPSSLSGYRNEFGFTCFPTLTMVGARYVGLPAIKAFVKKEEEAREAIKYHDIRQLSMAGTIGILQGAGVTVRICNEKKTQEVEIRRISATLKKELGVNVPNSMIREAAQKVYKAFSSAHRILIKAQAKRLHG